MSGDQLEKWFGHFPMIELPEQPTLITLTADTKLDSKDYQRFYDLGGRVNANGFRVFVDGDSGITLDALNALLTGKDPS